MQSLPILVVEDSFLVAASLEDALLDAGHKVVLAGSVAEAEAHMLATGFRAALLDFLLQDGNSLGLARKLHADGCSVALISGAGHDVAPHEPAIAARFAKPMDERELVDWVSSVHER